jgi:hypothetical protein
MLNQHLMVRYQFFAYISSITRTVTPAVTYTIRYKGSGRVMLYQKNENQG